MKIWFDFTNSPHINFFDHLIKELENDHELIITCRKLANTIDLLNIFGYNYKIIGSHSGRNKIKKAIGFIIRVIKLLWFLNNKEADVAISHSSFYSPIVSWILGIHCIYLNDNEHALGNRVAFIFANKIMVPEFLNIEKVIKQGAKKEKIVVYPGVKEGVYLWAYNIKQHDKSSNGRIIYIRPEPWTAQYYKGRHNFIDDLLVCLHNQGQIILLPRDEQQRNHYQQEKFKGIKIPKRIIKLNEIIKRCDLFIGAGGTMTREAAVCGIPTISIYQDELLDVDKYLIDSGFMIHKKELDPEFVIEFLKHTEIQNPSQKLLKKGKEAYELIKTTLLDSSA